jgi:uncharacterized protein YqjF (DUF2071 family)
MGRIGFHLPYLWSRMAVRAAGDTVSYTSSRRWSGGRGAYSRITVRTGERIDEPSELEHFLTARWGMHNSFAGGVAYLPNHHPRWPLHRAELITCEENLVTEAGLPAPSAAPVSVLYSPGVPVRLGRPVRRPEPLPAAS